MNFFSFKKFGWAVLLAALLALGALVLVGCGDDDDDEDGGGGGSGGTGTVQIANNSGTYVSTIRITQNTSGGKLLASRTANLSNGSRAVFSDIPAGRVYVRVDIGSGTSFDSRNKSITLKKGQVVTLSRTSRALN